MFRPGVICYNALSSLLVNIKAYWKCNETEGTNINDSIGSNDLTFSGTGSVGQPGIIDKAVEFTGVDDILTLTMNMGLYPSGSDFSFSMWVYLHSVTTANQYQLIHWYPSGSNACQVFLSSDERIYFFVWNSDDTSFYGATDKSPITINDWHHLVFVNKTGDVPSEFWIDSISVGGMWSGNFSGTLKTPTDTLTFGQKSGAFAIDGKICEIGYWDKALTEAEVLELYNSGVGKTYPFN